MIGWILALGEKILLGFLICVLLLLVKDYFNCKKEPTRLRRVHDALEQADFFETTGVLVNIDIPEWEETKRDWLNDTFTTEHKYYKDFFGTKVHEEIHTTHKAYKTVRHVGQTKYQYRYKAEGDLYNYISYENEGKQVALVYNAALPFEVYSLEEASRSYQWSDEDERKAKAAELSERKGCILLCLIPIVALLVHLIFF